MTVDPGLLSPGTRTADIIVRLSQDGDQRAVRVTAIVSEQGGGGGGGGGGGVDAVIAATPLSLGFSTPNSGSDPAARTLEVQNDGSGTLDYQVNISYAAQGEVGWLDISPTSGSSTNSPVEHQVSVTTAGLEPGLHSALLLVSGNAANSPFEIAVNLTVGSGPILTVNPNDFTFNAFEGVANPSGQALIVGSQGETMSYQISANQPWLTVEPAGGNTLQGPGSHTVRVDTDGLTAGTFLGKLTIDSPTATNAPLIVDVTLSIHPPGSLTAFPSSVSFLGAAGTPVTTQRIVSLAGASLSGLAWTAEVDPPEATWIKASPGRGGVPGNLIIAIDNADLAAGQYNADVRIVPFAENAALSNPAVVAQTAALAAVPVQLILQDSGPVLDASPAVLIFSAVEGDVISPIRVLQIGNRGGGDLAWTARVETDNGEDWLGVLPTGGSGPATARVTAEVSAMAAGVYQGRVILDQGGSETEVPVALVVSPAGGVLRTDRVGVLFDGAAGDGEWSRTVRVFALGETFLSWTTRIRELTGPGVWLDVHAEQGDPSRIRLTAGAEGLPAGVYTAVVEISPDAEGPLRFLTARFLTVVLRIRPNGVSPRPTIEPSGLIFVADTDAPITKPVTISTNGAGVIDFQAAASTYDGGAWLSVEPMSGSTSAAGEVELTVGVNPSEFANGVERGLIGITFGDGIVQSVPVSVFRPAEGPSPSPPSGLRINPLSPLQNFNGSSGRPLYLEAVLTDAARGIAISGEAALTAEFSNGDGAVTLEPVGGGIYSATWTPRNAAPQLSVRLTAISGGSTAEAVLIGAVESATAPNLLPFGAVNAAGFGAGRALAPGAIFSSFGSGLAGGLFIADAVPLPFELGGAALSVGGVGTPLYFASGGQINAQLPFETTGGAVSQIIARVDGVHSVPQDVVVAGAGPGIFTNPLPFMPVRAVAQNEDLRINRPSNPAAPGEAVTLYLSGLGETDPALDTGQEAPAAEPFARAVLSAAATIGGESARIFFLGMTPRFVGLAQANLIVPESSPHGPDVPVVITVDGQASNSAVIAVEDPQ